MAVMVAGAFVYCLAKPSLARLLSLRAFTVCGRVTSRLGGELLNQRSGQRLQSPPLALIKSPPFSSAILIMLSDKFSQGWVPQTSQRQSFDSSPTVSRALMIISAAFSFP